VLAGRVVVVDPPGSPDGSDVVVDNPTGGSEVVVVALGGTAVAVTVGNTVVVGLRATVVGGGGLVRGTVTTGAGP
jgi:hypothetical protein